jgi:hypothetical protein
MNKGVFVVRDRTQGRQSVTTIVALDPFSQ